MRMGKSKKLRRKDPFAPKAPLSSFMEFCKVERVKLLGERGKLPLVTLGQELGRMWREVDPEKREVFEERARETAILTVEI